MSDFRVPVGKKIVVGETGNPWFWNPGRFGIQGAPEHFAKRLKEMGEELAITWNPVNERWQVWMKSNGVNHKICRGWKLLFIHNGPSGEYLPLDERIFARLYAASVMAHGSAKAYMDRIMAEYERDQEKKEANNKQDAIDRAMPYWDHSQIKVAMRGRSSGDKFSTYHAGE